MGMPQSSIEDSFCPHWDLLPFAKFLCMCKKFYLHTVLDLLGKIIGIYLENKIPSDFKTVLTSKSNCLGLINDKYESCIE